MLGMMSNKGGQNGVQQQPGGMADLAAMFGSNRPMAPQPGMPMPGQGVQVPQIMQPQRPVLAPPPRVPMPQPVVAPAAKPAALSFRDMVIRSQMNRSGMRRRGEK